MKGLSHQITLTRKTFNRPRLGYMMLTVLRIRIFFVLFCFGSGSSLDLNFGSGFQSGSGLFMKNTLEIQII
jgi:hypothetical protein